jgi:hypothetical protein
LEAQEVSNFSKHYARLPFLQATFVHIDVQGRSRGEDTCRDYQDDGARKGVMLYDQHLKDRTSSPSLETNDNYYQHLKGTLKRSYMRASAG